MMKHWLLTLGLAATTLVAQADEAARASLIERLEATATLVADFRQETYGEGELRGDSAKGSMYIERPLKFAWLVEEPYEQQVISDGEMLWVYDPDLEQATYQPVENQVLQSPAMILAQPKETLTESYEVVMAGSENLTSYRLYPTDPDAVFSDMTLLFEHGQISEIRLTDNLGQDTRITLSDVKTGEPIDPARFEFEPPPGTDVFQQM